MGRFTQLLMRPCLSTHPRSRLTQSVLVRIVGLAQWSLFSRRRVGRRGRGLWRQHSNKYIAWNKAGAYLQTAQDTPIISFIQSPIYPAQCLAVAHIPRTRPVDAQNSGQIAYASNCCAHNLVGSCGVRPNLDGLGQTERTRRSLGLRIRPKLRGLRATCRSWAERLGRVRGCLSLVRLRRPFLGSFSRCVMIDKIMALAILICLVHNEVPNIQRNRP